MSSPIELGIALASASVAFVYVGLRAFQQLNVVHGNYKMVIPTSIMMSIGDVAMVLFIIKVDNWMIGITNGLGAGLGCCAAMFLSKLFYGKKEKR
jgi:hypothetical protein